MSVCNAMLFKYEHVTSDRRDEWVLLHDSGQARNAMHFKASFGGECVLPCNTFCPGQIMFRGRHPSSGEPTFSDLRRQWSFAIAPWL